MNKFIELFQHHPDPIFLADAKARITYWNTPADKILGKTFSSQNVKIVAKKGIYRYHPSLDIVLSDCITAKESAIRWIIPLPGDINKPPIKLIVTPIKNGKKITGAWAICHCMPDDPEANESDPIQINPILRVLSFLMNMIESTANGIVVMDPQGKVLIFNKSMENMTGFSAHEVIGIPGGVDLFYGWNTAKKNMDLMRGGKYGKSGMLNMLKTTLKDRSGNRFPASLSAGIMIENGEEAGTVGIFGDLRESERLSRELGDAQENLIHADRNAALGKLSASVAHEINNPLSGILMFAEILQKALGGDTTYKDDLKEIIEQTKRCKSIVKNLLGFSRKSGADKTSFDLPRAFHQCLDIVLPQAKFKDIDVKYDFQEYMPEMEADKVQIQQVFTNLVLNAADAINGTGTIIIKACHDIDNDCFFLEFSDTGPGIPEDKIEKIFQSFYTTKPVGYGTGLGLSITQDIINNHNGTIKVKNIPKGGTVFLIRLPRQQHGK